MTIRRFEDIEAWKEAIKLVVLVYNAIKSNESFVKDNRLVQQIQAAEVQSHIYVAFDQKYLSKDVFKRIYEQANTVSKLNSGFIKYLKSQLDGSK